jgi:hypothetical protein
VATIALTEAALDELKAEIDTLQRQALALGGSASTLPPEVVLGVRAVRRVDRRVSRAA